MNNASLRRAAVIALVPVLAACGSSTHSSVPPTTGHAPAPVARPNDQTDAIDMFTAFLDATYTPNAAGGWYRGGGEQSVSGAGAGLEILVRASTAAEARQRCPAIGRAAAYFLHGYKHRITLRGRIDVRSGNAVTFKNATFPPVACPALQAAGDPVRATMPADATAAAGRLSAFFDDYLRGMDWFVGALHDVGANGAQVVTISVSDGAAAASSRCTAIRPFVTWFLGSYHAKIVVEPGSGRSVTC